MDELSKAGKALAEKRWARWYANTPGFQHSMHHPPRSGNHVDNGPARKRQIRAMSLIASIYNELLRAESHSPGR